ncbi:extracellular solute-binding protein [Ruminococcaceae bacterium OttesenSCG-928-A16]|nr:extracellular solute-binding protein [Ruminococcaceae bacterium OttesenSCG-928-A16]
MKKLLALVSALTLSAALLAGCASAPASTPASTGSTAGAASTAAEAKPVELRVVSSFSGTDGNRKAFETAYKAWEAATGNTVKDESQTSDETWKAKVLADFETGSDPDVLFFFNGNDANTIVEGGKVVSIEDIRKEYPNYASNMNDSSIPASPVDGKQYAVPTAGYWEGMFTNTKVLEDCGLTAPDANTTWDEFLEMCETIKAKGYTPIAASLQQVPHYWFEFTILNNDGVTGHLNVPATADDAAGKAWQAGLEDIKVLYEKGYFPANTLSASDEETFQLMYDGKAAFAIDGSWKTGQIVDNVDADHLADYTCTYVPAKGDRKPTDIIGGLSMGYYITEKAWADPDKRAAAVSFVEALTTDEVIIEMAAGSAATALKVAPPKPADLNSLQEAAFNMVAGATSVTPAVQDYIKPEAKAQILETDTKLVANGSITAAQALENMIKANG